MIIYFISQLIFGLFINFENIQNAAINMLVHVSFFDKFLNGICRGHMSNTCLLDPIAGCARAGLKASVRSNHSIDQELIHRETIVIFSKTYFPIPVI